MTTHLALEFVPTGRWRRQPAGVAILLLAIAATAAASWVTSEALHRHRRNLTLEQDLKTQIATNERHARESRSQAPLPASLSGAVLILDYPWSEELGRMELVSSEKVSVVRFEQSAYEETGHLQLTAFSLEMVSVMVDRIKHENDSWATWQIKKVNRTPTGVRASVEISPARADSGPAALEKR